MKIVDVPLEVLTVEAFAPFGVVIQGGGASTDFEASSNRMINLGFEVDGHAALYVIRYVKQDMLASRFERHLTMTEARVSLGEPVVVLVAKPSVIDSPTAIPDIKSVRAFLINGGQGFIFKKGTWHSLDCYPTIAKYADFAFFTEREAEEELSQFQDLNPDRCKRSHIINLTQNHDVTFRVVDPTDLLKAEVR